MWTHNATWGLTAGTREGQTTVLVAVGGVMGMLGVVTVVLNLLLLIGLLVHEPSRSRSFHLHIANMAAAAILQGAGVLPLWAHYLIQGTWLHGDAVCRWWLAADTMATGVSALAIVVTACDRFIYLLCWRFVKEGGKYVTSFILMFLSWLMALTLTLTLTLMRVDVSLSHVGVQVEGLCNWGPLKGGRMVAARLVMYALGAGLGTGLCLALVTLPCLGRGDLLPIDEDEGELAVRRKSLLTEEEKRRASKSLLTEEEKRKASKSLEETLPKPLQPGSGIEEVEDEEDDENFPRFLMVKKTDRLEERDRWKWQVSSLLAVTVAWALLWLPSHLFVFADKLGLGWHIPRAGIIACVILGYAHAAIMPLLWLLHGPVRAAMAALIFCRCCQDEEDEDEDSIEFQDVGPYRQGEVPPPPAAAAAGASTAS